MIYHPMVVNQFYRLDRDTPTGPLVKTTPWNHTHADAAGHVIDWDGLLCMCAEGAVALDAQTLGKVRVSPGQIHDHQDDNSGGIGVDDVKVAWQRGWNQNLLTPADYDWNDVVYAVRSERRHAIVGVNYDYVSYEYRVQKTGSFDHAIGFDDGRPTDGDLFRYDSLDTKALFAPQSAYRAAAEMLALRERGSRAKLFVGLTAPRPLISSTEHFEVIIGGYTNLYTAPNGRVVAAVRKGTYVCTRSLEKGQWWFRIISTSNYKGRYFKANSNMEAHRV